MKQYIFLTSLLLCMVLSSSCNKSNPVNNGNANELIPLKAGNTWVDLRSLYDSTGVVTDTFIDSLWVSKDTTVNGQDYFIIFEQSGHPGQTPYPQTNTYLARNTPSGYYERYSYFNFDTKLYDYPYGLKDTTIIAWNEAVTVPAGTFNCTVYKSPTGLSNVDSISQILYSKVYICPNIGIIKKQFYIPNNAYAGYSSILTRVILN